MEEVGKEVGKEVDFEVGEEAVNEIEGGGGSGRERGLKVGVRERAGE